MGSLFSKTWEKCPVGSYSPWNTYESRDPKLCTKKRILLIGTAGSGKSSTINSVYTAVYGEHIARAKYGSGTAGHVTKTLRKYDLSKIKDERKTKEFKKHQLPTFFDMCGLPPHISPTERFEKILKAILRGRLPVGTNVHDLLSNEEAEIPECNGEPVDRVVYVAAADEELPTEYCDSVRKVCEEVFGAEFTVFGILTKGDQMTYKTSEKYKRFTEMMQAGGAEHRILVIANYCSAVCGGSPATWKGRKDIDGPFLAFLAEICRKEYDKKRKVDETRLHIY